MGTPLRVTVVGGGIAGLTAAHRVAEVSRERAQPIEVTLVEAGPRLGGNIRTEHLDAPGGPSGQVDRPGRLLVEAGPDGFVTERPWALALAERLGLGSRVVRPNMRQRRTYVVHGGRLHALPEGFLLLAPSLVWPVVRSSLFSWRGKARMGLDLVLPRARAASDESLASFVTRRLGLEALERVAAPLAAGIHATVPQQLSLAATFPRFRDLEREHRSLILGLRRGAGGHRARGSRSAPPPAAPFATLAGGMGELADALTARLPAGAVHLNRPVAALRRGIHGARWEVRCDDGSTLEADAVILAGEAHRMAAVVRELDGELGRALTGIPYASSITVTLAYPRMAVRHALDAWGFVVAPTEPYAVRACTFAGAKYPERAPADLALLRVSLGRGRDPGLFERDDALLVRVAHDDAAALLGITAPPALARVARHRRVLPQYEVGHLDRVAAIEARLTGLPGLALVGAAYRGVGITDIVRAAEETAERIISACAVR
jgi:protoporphyrinogen/coproporphyrinogen III oxidase